MLQSKWCLIEPVFEYESVSLICVQEIFMNNFTSLFLNYINNLTEGLTTIVMLFAGDTFLFSVVHFTQISANDFN